MIPQLTHAKQNYHITTSKQMLFYDIINITVILLITCLSSPYLLHALNFDPVLRTPLFFTLCVDWLIPNWSLCAFPVMEMTVCEIVRVGQHLMFYFSLQECSGDDPVWS